MLGATLDEWMHFDFVLGLGENLLPCVPYSPDVRILPGSALEGKLGKIPSMFNGRAEAHGLTGWQKREFTRAELAYWSGDRRLNLCVRTGPLSQIYAFDIDITDERADAVAEDIEKALGLLPERLRDNSQKRLFMVRMEAPSKKRIIKLDNEPRGPKIEMLGDGQQFVACGTHESGVRYRWHPELPWTIPTITLAQLDTVWSILTARYAMTPTIPVTQNARAEALTDSQMEVMTEISEDDWLHLIECLRFLLPYAGDEQVWAEIGLGLLSIKDCGKPVRQLWLDFSKKAPNWEEGAAELWWETHTRG